MKLLLPSSKVNLIFHRMGFLKAEGFQEEKGIFFCQERMGLGVGKLFFVCSFDPGGHMIRQSEDQTVG